MIVNLVSLYYAQFVAHPYTQKMMATQFYQTLLAQSQLAFVLLSLLTIFCYPLFCLAYLLVPYGPLKDFLKIP